MVTYRTADFWAPALHANTLLQISVPEGERNPVVRPLPIKHGEHAAVGVVKRMLRMGDELLVADDGFRMSSLSLPTEETSVPIVTSQSTHAVPSRGTSVWTGLASLSDSSVVSSLSTGRLTLYNNNAEAAGTRKLGAPVLTLSTPDVGGAFALGGKELELGVFDPERTFASSSTKASPKDLYEGEVWRAKNVPHNNLQLRVPVHHLCSSYLPRSTTDIVTGTKGGNLRRYDTRQRKPVADWKMAREGGVAALAPSRLEDHTVWFADHSNLLGALDLRTGKLLYSVPGLAATPHSLLSLPSGAEWTPPNIAPEQVAGLATVSSDATLRVCGVTPAPTEAPKGNWGSGKKASVMASVGGVGVGTFVFNGFGSGKDVVEKKEGEGEEESDEDLEVGEDEEDEMWEGMGEVGEADDSGDDDESDEEQPPRKRRK
ncbi:hypothetical protein CspeluHIS016_0801810 [Cutaneotrichosporon spelunceum]|uniref:Ribosome biogenesis protein NSA1 n=1 Tax=Cutaneotrichosporon spelunceum TaxID=1672016 RepID=A0AAD3TZX4_9TREE|nr:hypothetical protein CspeluHIS016_0801810 [Cutaneotrichosporon spelunceum]